MSHSTVNFEPLLSPRLGWLTLGDPAADDSAGEDVARLLSQTPRCLPVRYFYDEPGSALFERICELPEYYPTRTEREILDARAAEIAALAGSCDLVELGSGSGAKTALLIDALIDAQGSLRFAPIDVSGEIMREGAEALLAAHAELEVRALVGTYEQGLAALDRAFEDGDGARPRLVIFLGSTIGNLTPAETEGFLSGLRAALRPGDHFLVGTDLDKDPEIIERAYNDAAGVTAAFNLNMLRHLNRIFRGDFAPEHFSHQAFYDRSARQIEMHLRSERDQSVRLAALDFEFALAAGETIRTEISRKFDLAEFGAGLEGHGFRVVERWTDPRVWFGLTLARAVEL